MSAASDIVIVGAAETTDLGAVPGLSVLGLHLDAARNALSDTGVEPSEIDGIPSTAHDPAAVAFALGIRPGYMDSTMVGGRLPWSERHRAGAGHDYRYEADDHGLSSHAITSAFLSYISRHQID